MTKVSFWRFCRSGRTYRKFLIQFALTAAMSTTCFAQDFSAFPTTTPVPLPSITPTATRAPTLTPTPLGSATVTPTTTATPSNTASITPTATITATPTPFKINCKDPGLGLALAKLASGDLLQNIPRPWFAERIEKDCEEYLKQREPGDTLQNRPDSVVDLFNYIRPQVEDHGRKIEARLKLNPSDPLTDYALKHPYMYGTEVEDLIENQMANFTEYASNYLKCADYKIHGFCVNWEFTTFGMLPVAADIWMSYRWEWGKLQGAENGWENAHIPKVSQIVKLGLEADDYLTFDTAAITTLMKGDAPLVRQGVKNAFNVVSFLPGMKMPELGPAVESAALPDNIMQVLRAGPGSDPERRWRNVKVGNFSAAKDAVITRSFTDFFLGPVISRIPLLGLKHNTKWNPAYMLMPLASKGGAFFPLTRPMRDALLPNLAQRDMAELYAFPLACQYLDSVKGMGKLARLQTPPDLLGLVADPNGEIMQRFVDQEIPGAQFKIRDLAKHCARSGQGAIRPYTAIDTTANDPRTALEKQMLKFVNTMNAVYQAVDFIMYTFNDESEKKGHDDRAIWYDDKVFNENRFNPDDGACQHFYAGSLREDREPSNESGKEGFRLTNRYLANGKIIHEAADLGHGKVDTHWANAGLVKRFSGCDVNGDWDWKICPAGCPEEILD